MLDDISKIINEDPDIKKLRELSDKDLTNIFNQISIEDIKDLMDELNGGDVND